MNKLKVLMCSEASFLNSGFSIYAKEILSRLYATGKYEIAEFASYAVVNDPKDKDIPWSIYANAVNNADPRHAEYTSRTDNMFGRWRFDKTVVDFKPDVVIDVRDYWMSAYQEQSPARKLFHWILMPTVDSAPQQPHWIDTFLNADAIFTYSDWGADVLKNQSGGKINYIDTASPGVDLSVFKIKDKQECRKAIGVPSDAIVIGSVMRNQKRKLIPELFVSFKKLLDKYKKSNNPLGEKLFLYLHTSFPDAGWDIPESMKENGILNKVLFTQICRKCNHVSCGVFRGPQTVCPKCFTRNQTFPNVTAGVTSEQLSTIYNTFDMYVQYAICEGFGMPQVEAGACGIPIATVDYSAMCDVINKLNAYPIEIKTYFKELETRAIRVYPNNDSLISTIDKFINMPEPIQYKKRLNTRKLTEKHYNWDNIAKKWEKYLDSLNDSGYRADWSHHKRINKIANAEANSNVDALISVCRDNLLDINAASSSKMLSYLNDADYGFQLNGLSTNPFDMNKVAEQMNIYVSNNNQLCDALDNKLALTEDFIQYAKLKANN
jgi:glycosyltransferase involved in cell wall biosynthesis